MTSHLYLIKNFWHGNITFLYQKKKKEKKNVCILIMWGSVMWEDKRYQYVSVESLSLLYLLTQDDRWEITHREILSIDITWDAVNSQDDSMLV